MLNIRQASESDIPILSALGIATCYEAYFHLDPSLDLSDYCMREYSLEQIAADLDDKNSTHLLAEFDGKAIGFAKLREGKKIKCLEGKNGIEIQRIYLLEKMKGKGFGKALIEKCAEIGSEKGYELIWLGVWEENTAAQRFYERVGYQNIGTTDFSDGKSSFINLVMAKNLNNPVF